MRTFAISCFAFAIVVFLTGTIIQASHKDSTVATISSIDPTALTLKAGNLPVVQVNEPF